MRAPQAENFEMESAKIARFNLLKSHLESVTYATDTDEPAIPSPYPQLEYAVCT